MIAADRLQSNRVFTVAFVAIAFAGLGMPKWLQPDDAALGQSPRETNADEQTPVKAPAESRITAADNARFRSEIENGKASKKRQHATLAAIYWLARHQLADGSWSLQRYNVCCTDKTCTGAGSVESFSAATAMALLPFLDAFQTQATKGPFKRTVGDGIDWLVRHQKAKGDLSGGGASQIYSHALATIALCKDYGMTRDIAVGRAAQKAVNFIQATQNSKTGGWRYHPGEDGDTSLLGWQVAALREATLAGLSVNPETRNRAKTFLKSCAPGGADAGKFSYLPGSRPSLTMSAVGILCSQKFGTDAADPEITGGIAYLMANQPDANQRNVYYWYFASHALHNMADKDWDTWNSKIRKILVETQQREGCATGSWDPEKPTKDAWGNYGGRLMMTSFSCQILEFFGERIWLYRVNPK
jgi:hypothetical protein